MTQELIEFSSKPRRQVSYNQDAVLCPICKKRIRLNNDGRVRVHVVGKTGSEKCSGSDVRTTTDTEIQKLADEVETKLTTKTPPTIFSDAS